MCFRAERKMVESGGYQEWVPFSNLLKYKDLCLFTDMQVSLTIQTMTFHPSTLQYLFSN